MKISSCGGNDSASRDDTAVVDLQLDLAAALREIFASSRIYMELVSEVQLIDIQGTLLTINFDVQHYNSEAAMAVIQELYSGRDGAGILLGVNVSWTSDLLMCSGDGCMQSRF